MDGCADTAIVARLQSGCYKFRQLAGNMEETN